MTHVNAFLYRLPRFETNFPVEFIHGSSTSTLDSFGLDHATATPGLCVNVSDSGIFARFALPLADGTEGLLRLKPANRVFSLHATVIRTEGIRCGLQFLFRENRERQFIRAIVEAATPNLTHTAFSLSHP